MSLSAQETGSFQQSVNFSESDYNATRTLYFFVPEDYDANQSYPLVVGFRGGPHSNAGQFRTQLTFLADSIGAIIMCPENADHFWNEEGLTKQLFKYSVETTMDMYNINPDMIYLTGLSYGGRHAVIVSMDTDDGPIPNLRGVIPFATGSEGDLVPNYDAVADFPPACICIGTFDSANFKNVANNLHNDITAAGGISLLNEIVGVGHTVAFPTYPEEMMECINFIESQYGTTSIEASPVLDKAYFVAYPNPANNILRFEFRKEIHASQIYITDLSGKLLRNIPVDKKEIDLEEFSSGLYIINVVHEKGISTQKISIQK